MTAGTLAHSLIPTTMSNAFQIRQCQSPRYKSHPISLGSNPDIFHNNERNRCGDVDHAWDSLGLVVEPEGGIMDTPNSKVTP